MKKGILLIGSMAAIAFAAAAAWAVGPTPIPFPQKGAALYKTTFVHAMEPCEVAPVGVVTLHLKGPGGGKKELVGCAPVVSDPVTFQKGQLTLSKNKGKFLINVKGLPATQKVQLGLTLRSSREKANFKEGNELEVTYLPLKLVCPVVTASGGKVIQKSTVDQCTPLTVGTESLASAQLKVDPVPGSTKQEKTIDLQLEVLDAVLVDAGGTTKCVGGANAGNACTTDTDCPAQDAARHCRGECQGGDNNYEPCGVNADCPDIFAGACALNCIGGENDLDICTTDANCPGGKCGGWCDGGLEDEGPCHNLADCPDVNPGTCPSVFGRAGIAR